MFVSALLALVVLTHVHYCKYEQGREIACERKDGLLSAESALSGLLWRLFQMADLFSPYPVPVRPQLSPAHLPQALL